MKKLKKNDQVIVIAGKYKGSIGTILDIDRKKQTVRVDKVNMVKKHVKPSQMNPDGGIQTMEAPISISNVAYYLKKGKDGVGTKIEIKIDEKGNHTRVAKKNNKEV